LKGKRDEAAFRKDQDVLQFLKQCDDEEKLNLYYFDESGFSTIPVIPYAWQPIGKTKEILSVRSQQLNVLGFMNRKNEAYFNVVEGRVNTDKVIEVMDSFAEFYYLSQENKIK